MAGSSTFERRLLAAAVLAWLVAAIVNAATDPFLGYDEAAYATVARGDDTPYWLYRSRGVIMLAKLGVALGDDEWQLRLPFALIGIGLPLAAYVLGRAAFDARTGAWAAAVLVTGHQLLARNGNVLGDVPATIGIVTGIAIVIGELSREDGPRRRLLLAAPAFALAFYMRYGSAPVVLVAVVLAPLVWWRSTRRAPLLVLATGALLAILLVPHVLHSLDETGSMLGVLRFSAGVPRREYIGEGLVTYVTSNPFYYYGVLVAPCLIAAFAALARCRKAPVYLLVVGIAQITAIGLQSHGQPRYVFVAVVILTVVGVGMIRTLSPRALPRAMLAVLAAAWLASVVYVVRGNRRHKIPRASITAAADTIRRDSKRPCMVLATSLPQILWYSGCHAGRWYYELQPAWLAAHRDNYLVETVFGDPIDTEWARTFHVTPAELPTGNATSRVWLLR